MTREHACNRPTAGAIAERHPRLVAAIVADARITAAHRGERFEFRSTSRTALLQALRLALVTDAFLAQCLYRMKAATQRLGIPLLPRLLHRIAMSSAQVSIGDPVVVEAGVYVIHGQVVIDGYTEIGTGTTLGPFVTIGLLSGNLHGPGDRPSRQHRHRSQGSRAGPDREQRSHRRQLRGAAGRARRCHRGRRSGPDRSREPSMPEPRRFFIVHMQKSAGTSLRDRLRNQFPESAIYPNRTDGADKRVSVISLRHLLERWDARGDEIRLVAGHFPLATTEVLGAPFVTLTVLRPPVERTLSYLRHRARDQQGRRREVARRDLRRPLPVQRADPQPHDEDAVTHRERSSSRETVSSVMSMTRLSDWSARSAHSSGWIASDSSRISRRFCRELEIRYSIDLGEPTRSNATEAMPASKRSRSTHRCRQCAGRRTLRVRPPTVRRRSYFVLPCGSGEHPGTSRIRPPSGDVFGVSITRTTPVDPLVRSG